MKIALVQTKPLKGEVAANLERHLAFIERAAAKGADVVIFPELSLTGYEPRLAKDLVMDEDDAWLEVFRAASDAKKLVIGVGAPTRTEAGLHISLILFRPGAPRRVYSKGYLHPDEEPFFAAGAGFPSFVAKGTNIGLAICYELSVPEHAADAVESGADVYVASVAKHADGVARAHERMAEIARTYKIPALMVNSIGEQDDFIATGGTAVWSGKGEEIARLGEAEEGMMVFDTETGATMSV